MQKNYSLPCTGVYRPLGGVRANVAFNAGSKTWACGGDPQPDGPSSPTLPPQGDIISAEPLKVCKVFLLRVYMNGAPLTLARGWVLWIGTPTDQFWGGRLSGPRLPVLDMLWQRGFKEMSQHPNGPRKAS